jgi:hypothetical protein
VAVVAVEPQQEVEVVQVVTFIPQRNFCHQEL